MPSPNVCRAVWLGDMDYLEAYDLPLSLVEKVHSGQEPNTLLLLEHPPVYTRGRLSKPEHILLAADELEARGIAVYEADRGGQVTFHGPGQLVGYPVSDVRAWGGPLKYVRTLEQIIVATLADFGVIAGVIDGITGVWAGEAKIAAIGVRVRHWVTYHGIAINLEPELEHFSGIVPCGIAEHGVTSLWDLGVTATMPELDTALMETFEEVFKTPIRRI